MTNIAATTRTDIARAFGVYRTPWRDMPRSCAVGLRSQIVTLLAVYRRPRCQRMNQAATRFLPDVEHVMGNADVAIRHSPGDGRESQSALNVASAAGRVRPVTSRHGSRWRYASTAPRDCPAPAGQRRAACSAVDGLERRRTISPAPRERSHTSRPSSADLGRRFAPA